MLKVKLWITFYLHHCGVNSQSVNFIYGAIQFILKLIYCFLILFVQDNKDNGVKDVADIHMHLQAVDQDNEARAESVVRAVVIVKGEAMLEQEHRCKVSWLSLYFLFLFTLFYLDSQQRKGRVGCGGEASGDEASWEWPSKF